MSEEEKIVVAGKVPRKKKVLYFLRFYAWSMIVLGVGWGIWYMLYAFGYKFELFCFLFGVLILFGCVVWGLLGLKVAKTDEDSWDGRKADFSWVIFWMKALCVIGAVVIVILWFVFLMATAMSRGMGGGGKQFNGICFALSCIWFFIGACSFWGAIGRILNRLERRKRNDDR